MADILAEAAAALAGVLAFGVPALAFQTIEDHHRRRERHATT